MTTAQDAKQILNSSCKNMRTLKIISVKQSEFQGVIRITFSDENVQYSIDYTPTKGKDVMQEVSEIFAY